MKIFSSLIYVFIVCFSCKKNTKTQLLEQNTIALTQPIVKANTTLIDSFVVVKSTLKLKGVSIHYTSNGDKPTQNSKTYTTPLSIFKPGTYKFKAFHDHWKPSEVSKLKLYKKGLKVNSIILKTKPAKKYSGQGDITLINQKKAALHFTDPQWIGFDTLAIASILFDKKTYIKNLNISYLEDVSSWIFPPERVIIKINENEKEIKVPINKTTNRSNKMVQVPIHAKVNSLTLKIYNLKAIPNWHEGQGQKAWLFLDELIFN